MGNQEQIIALQEQLISDLMLIVTNMQSQLNEVNIKVSEYNAKRFEVLNVVVELPKEIPLPVEDFIPDSIPVTEEEIKQLAIDFPHIRITDIDAEYYLLFNTRRGQKIQLSKKESYNNIVTMINNL